MALDGIFLYCLSQNIKETLINSKIDKVNQPEKDEVILTIRKDRKNLKLLISSSPKYPRIHFTTIQKTNPLKPPMFNMVLRKYLIGGRITNIEQLNGDRILKFHIESTDDMGFDSIYYLIIEIMGRHSNITLVRERDNKIMECIKHITPNINSYRVLYPGATYVYPPTSKKLNPHSFECDSLSDLIKENNIEINQNIFSNCFTGISTILSNELYSELLKLQDNFSMDNLTSNISKILSNFLLNLSSKHTYNIYLKDGNYKDFYCYDLETVKDTFEEIQFNDPNELLDSFYLTKDKQERLNLKSSDLQKLILNNIDRCLKKESKLNQTLKECLSKEDYKIKGDLLTSYIYSIKNGESLVKLLNFYSEKEEYLEITLDPYKSPSENIQLYYKKYNKYKKSEESANHQLKLNTEELTYLNSVLTNIQNVESYIEIDDIKSELVETGYLRFRKSNKSKKNKPSKPLHFISSDGIDIYVGKNNIQNDELSLKFAHKNHMWLHTKNIPGSHVIITSFEVPDRTLEEAAIIAAYYSKAKTGTKVPVDYTLVKNLKKPNGSKPGMVIYHTNYTLYTEPSLFDFKPL